MAWDSSFEAKPLGDTSPSGVDDAIRETKTEVKAVISDEHELDTSETGRAGEHKEGSAKAYFQTDETGPTTRPGGASLDANDAGRLNVVTNEDLGTVEADVWDGSAWQPIAPGPMTGVIAMFAANPNTGLRSTQWLLCDGQAVASATYPALYHHLTGGTDTGNAYVPDLRNAFVRGVDGAETRKPDPTASNLADRYNVQEEMVKEHDHELEGSTTELAAQSHTIDDPGHDHDVLARSGLVGSGGISGATSPGPPYEVTQPTNAKTTGITVDDHPEHSHDLNGTGAKAGTTEASTSVMGSETRPTNTALYYYIHI